MANAVFDRINKRSAELMDIYLRHGINLTRYSTHQARELVRILDNSNKQIRNIINRAKSIETKEQYRRISSEIRRASRELRAQLNNRLETDFKSLADAETRFVENAMRKVGVTANFELPAPSKIWSAASFGSYAENGRETFRSYLNGLGDNLFRVWDTNVRGGYIAGLTARQINRNVLGSVQNLDPGQMQALRRSLELNTRTMIAHLSETARTEIYQKNSSLFSGYRYVATLDSRTCPVCGELDGKVFASLEEAPQVPAHHNCRCLYIPEIKGMEGFDDDDTRASVDGPVSAKLSYQDWLAKQPEDVQRDILGATRFYMYKSGDPISSFVVDGRTLTLDQLAEREGFSFRSHNI